MPKCSFTLDGTDDPKQLVISQDHGGLIRIWFDDQLIGSVKLGVGVNLPDGSTVKLRRKYKAWPIGASELHVFRNGNLLRVLHVPSMNARFKTACRFLVVWGGCHVLLGLGVCIKRMLLPSVEAGSSDFVFIAFMLALGIAFLMLGILGIRKSERAFTVAGGLLGVECALLMFNMIQNDIQNNVIDSRQIMIWVFPWLFLVSIVVAGADAAIDLKNRASVGQKETP